HAVDLARPRLRGIGGQPAQAVARLVGQLRADQRARDRLGIRLRGAAAHEGFDDEVGRFVGGQAPGGHERAFRCSRTASAVLWLTRTFDSVETPAMWGVRMSVSMPAKIAPLSAVTGSCSKTSSAAPAICRSRRAAHSAGSSTMPP